MKRALIAAIACGALLVLASPALASYNSTLQGIAGLVSAWPLTETSGTTASDLQSANPGTYRGGYTLNQAGLPALAPSVAFNGSTGYVSLGDPVSLQPAHVTVVAWFKTTSSATERIFRKRNYGYGLELAAGKVRFWIYNSAATQYVATSATTRNDGAWHMAVGEYDGSHVNLFIDGANETTATAGVIHYAAGGSAIGRDGDASGNYFSGSLDSVAVFNTVLTPAQVSSLYSAGVATGTTSGQTDPATNVTDTTATGNGHGSCAVNPCTAWFQYSTDNFATFTATPHLTEPASGFTLAQNLTGLTASAQYSYRLATSENGGATHHWDMNGTDGGTAYTTFTTTAAPPPPSPPANTTAPAVTGTAQQDSTLTTDNGSWTNSPTRYTYAWQDCDSAGANCADIAGSTSSSYLLASSDVGSTVRSVVTACNAAGCGSPASSAATAVVTASSGGGVPVYQSGADVSGTPQQGAQLTAVNGSWTNNPTSYTYQWQDCDAAGANCVNAANANASNATEQTYYAQARQAATGHTLKVQVTACNASGCAAAPATTSATSAVATMPANNGYSLCNPTSTCSSIGFPTGGANTNITSTQSINTTVSNATYTVTNCAANPAISIGASGVLNNVTINLNGCGVTGVKAAAGAAGTVNGVEVYGGNGSGTAFDNVKTYQGIDYSTHSGMGFYLHGVSGISEASGAEMISYDDGGSSTSGVSVEIDNVTQSTFSGAIIGDDRSACAGGSGGSETGIGIGFGGGTDSGDSFGTLIGNSNAGYGVEIYMGTNNSTIGAIYMDATGDGNCPEGDPGLSIGGGVNHLTVGNVTSKNYTFGVIMGEDVNPINHDNTIHTLWNFVSPTANAGYSCVGLDRGSYNDVIGDQGGSLCQQAGGAQAGSCSTATMNNGPSNNWCGDVSISDRTCTNWTAGSPPTGTGCQYESTGPNGLPYNYNNNTQAVPPYGNTVDGLYATSSNRHPVTAVYLGPYTGSKAALVHSSSGGATAPNTVVGFASDYSSFPVYDASCTTPPTGGTCGNTITVTHP